MIAQPRAPKLLQQLPHAIRLHHYSVRTEKAYVGWVRRYVRFHGLRHPGDLGRNEIRRFLVNQDPGSVGDIVRAKQPSRLPVVLSREEVRALLDRLQGTPRVVGVLLYGSGLRLLEALQLRVKDVDFAGGEIRVRRAKGAKDRVTVLPGALTRSCNGIWSASVGSTSATFPVVPARLRCRAPTSARRPVRRKSGAGSTSFRPRAGISTPRATCAGIMSMSR